MTFDAADPGSKCTCPSRKFPCKHALALMLLAQKPGFTQAPVPKWVEGWMGRRRKSSAEAEKPSGASLSATMEPGPDDPRDSKDPARAEAARRKREATTRAAVAAGLQDLEAWISDQLVSGLPSLLNDLTGRTRRIAARMMDAKASGLASRIDEMAARILSHPPGLRPDTLAVELGKLVLLCRAWEQGDLVEPGLARTIGTSESRDEVLASPDTLRLRSAWKVVATQECTRPTGSWPS